MGTSRKQQLQPSEHSRSPPPLLPLRINFLSLVRQMLPRLTTPSPAPTCPSSPRFSPLALSLAPSLLVTLLTSLDVNGLSLSAASSTLSELSSRSQLTVSV